MPHAEIHSRRNATGEFRKNEKPPTRAAIKLPICLAIAFLVFLIPVDDTFTLAARRTLFILVLSAGLWLSEAMAAYAVALLAIGLEIALLGNPDGPFAKGPNDWQMFIEPMANPLIFLFLAGFLLSSATTKTGLDKYLIKQLLERVGTRPSAILLAVMLSTFFLSMFMSNTATTAMMLMMVAPILRKLPRDEPFQMALLLSVPFSANLGGMGSVIGTPPNAIAVGLLEPYLKIDFIEWMFIGVPPALIGLGILWLYLTKSYPCSQKELNPFSGDHLSFRFKANRDGIITAFTVAGTMLLWMTSGLHGIPTNAISFIPICIFTTTGVLSTKDIRELPWEVLLLLGGGLSLGLAVQETGLAAWIASLLPIESTPLVFLAVILSMLAIVLSNFMSNTAATNVILPIAIAAAVSGDEPSLVLPAALAASCAMALPISTPPNAIAYASGKLGFKDFLRFGIIIGLIMPFICTLWIWLIRSVI